MIRVGTLILFWSGGWEEKLRLKLTSVKVEVRLSLAIYPQKFKIIQNIRDSLLKKISEICLKGWNIVNFGPKNIFKSNKILRSAQMMLHIFSFLGIEPFAQIRRTDTLLQLSFRKV